MPTIKELHEQRAKLLADCRVMVDEQEKSGVLMDAEKRSIYDKLWADQESLKGRIADQERQAKAEAESAAMHESRGLQTDHESLKPTVKDGKPEPIEWEYRSHKVKLQPGTREYERATPDYGENFRNYLLTGETRALQADISTSGGYTLPAQFLAELIKAVDDQVFVRGLARVIPLRTGESIGAPALDADPADDTWVSELSAGTADSTMTFGKRTLTPTAVAKLIKVSNKLLRQSALAIDALVRDRLAYTLGITQEKAFMTGSGANQPLGVFTASAQGITTSQDVTTGNGTTTIGADNLREVFYTLKPQYRPTSVWVMHTDVVKAVSKLKTGDGQYLWTPGIRSGSEDVILGRPVYESRYAPSTFTSGKYLGILGNFSYYWIAESLNNSIRRLDELYAATDQVGFLDRAELDGMPVLSEAFARITLG